MLEKAPSSPAPGPIENTLGSDTDQYMAFQQPPVSPDQQKEAFKDFDQQQVKIDGIEHDLAVHKRAAEVAIEPRTFGTPAEDETRVARNPLQRFARARRVKMGRKLHHLEVERDRIRKPYQKSPLEDKFKEPENEIKTWEFDSFAGLRGEENSRKIAILDEEKENTLGSPEHLAEIKRPGLTRKAVKHEKKVIRQDKILTRKIDRLHKKLHDRAGGHTRRGRKYTQRIDNLEAKQSASANTVRQVRENELRNTITSELLAEKQRGTILNSLEKGRDYALRDGWFKQNNSNRQIFNGILQNIDNQIEAIDSTDRTNMSGNESVMLDIKRQTLVDQREQAIQDFKNASHRTRRESRDLSSFIGQKAEHQRESNSQADKVSLGNIRAAEERLERIIPENEKEKFEKEKFSRKILETEKTEKRRAEEVKKVETIKEIEDYHKVDIQTLKDQFNSVFETEDGWLAFSSAMSRKDIKGATKLISDRIAQVQEEEKNVLKNIGNAFSLSTMEGVNDQIVDLQQEMINASPERLEEIKEQITDLRNQREYLRVGKKQATESAELDKKTKINMLLKILEEAKIIWRY